MTMTQDTLNNVMKRDMMQCTNPKCTHMTYFIGRRQTQFNVHHVYWKSQYNKRDRDEPWNLSLLCIYCHDSIHVAGNKELDKYLKEIADKRKPPNEREKEISEAIIAKRKLRRAQYQKNIQRYKEKHGGLSPQQVLYRKMKGIIKE